MARIWSLLLAAILLAAAPFARAQDDEFSLDEPDGKAPAKAPETPPPAEEPALLGDEQALEEEASPHEEFRQSTDPYEDPNKAYYYLGGAWRFVRMPSWALEWFLEAAPAVGTAGSFFGEFAYRKDGFQVAADVGWMKWDFDGPFQLSGDPTKDTEWLTGRFNLLMLSATITWSTSFTDWLSLDYGIEAGVAFVFGSLIRSEAALKNGQWSECPGFAGSPALPNPTTDEIFYCDAPIAENDTNGDGRINDDDQRPPVTNSADELGAHYGVKAPYGISNSGIPRALPVLGPRLSLRFKPIHQLVIRVDVPLPVLPLGFVGGVGVQYGF